MIVELYAKSDVGRVRRGNEDNFLVLDLSSEQTWSGADGATPPDKLTRFTLGQKGLVLVVSDGMGGALAGDVASRMAVDSVREMLLGTEGEEACDPSLDLVECLKNATIYANSAIHLKSQEDSRCAGMGATFTGAGNRRGNRRRLDDGRYRHHAVGCAHVGRTGGHFYGDPLGRTGPELGASGCAAGLRCAGRSGKLHHLGPRRIGSQVDEPAGRKDHHASDGLVARRLGCSVPLQRTEGRRRFVRAIMNAPICMQRNFST